jgi:hypothetical protein
MPTGAVGNFTLRSSIQYVVQGKSGTEFQRDCAPDHCQASFVAIVRWDDVGQFIIDMLGSHTNLGGRIRRWAPEVHPFLPNHYCVGCKLGTSYGLLSASPGNPGMPHYDYCEVLCTFSPLLYDLQLGNAGDAAVDADTNNNELLRYVERKSGDKGEAISYLGQFKFASDNAPIPTPPAIMVPYRELLYVWHYVPDPITNLLGGSMTYYGCVNSLPFDRTREASGPPVTWPQWSNATTYNLADVVYNAGSTWQSLQAGNLNNTPVEGAWWHFLGVAQADASGISNGTVLYTGISNKERMVSPYGNILWRLTLSFLSRPQGWNNAFRPNNIGTGLNTDGWEPVVNTLTGKPPYRSADLNQLFKLFNPYPAPA